MVRLLVIAIVGALVFASRGASAQAIQVEWPSGERNPAAAIVSWDHDDDDDDGVPDAEQRPTLTADIDNEITSVTVLAPAFGAVRVRSDGGLRIVGGATLVTEAMVPVLGGRATVELVGILPSARANDASVTFEAGGGSMRVGVTVVAAVLLHGDHSIVWAHRDAVGVSHEITNNPTLPRAARWDETSPDRDNVRAEVWDPGGSRVGSVRIDAFTTSASLGLAPNLVRNALGDAMLERPHEGVPFRSRFVRLVGDDIDLRAPGIHGQTLLVGLRDRVRLRYRRATVAGVVTADVRVGRPGSENGSLAARRARWHMVVMRDHVGGRPMIARDDANAVRIARDQVAISNEIYLQCFITFGDPLSQPVDIADPPQGSLLAVGDDDGLRSLGGTVRLRAGTHALPPLTVPRGRRPIEVAELIADAITATGLNVRVTENRRTDYGADGSADLVIRDAHGHLVEFAAVSGGALTTDARQSLSVGRVDFTDGVEEFSNLNSAAGTLEERTLVKSLADDDRATIELFFVNRFTRQTRIGEAFVEGDAGTVINALIIDRAGVGAQREAWTQSHEAGHVLLNQPWHPDNVGPDRPWLLMDADASLGSVTGPKRLGADECQRIHDQSGTSSLWPLLSRYDEVRPSPRAREYATWPTRELFPRGVVSSSDATTHGAAAPSGPTVRDARASELGLRIQ